MSTADQSAPSRASKLAAAATGAALALLASGCALVGSMPARGDDRTAAQVEKEWTARLQCAKQNPPPADALLRFRPNDDAEWRQRCGAGPVA